MTWALFVILGGIMLAALACFKVAGDCSEIERKQEEKDAKGGDENVC